MIPNTQFPLNPGTNQQVNNWVDHSAQQVMHPLGQPVAQPLVPGQPPAVIPPPPGTPPPPPVPGNEHLSALDTPGTRPYIRANPTPETMPFYNADLPDQGKSLFYDAVNAWQLLMFSGLRKKGRKRHLFSVRFSRSSTEALAGAGKLKVPSAIG
jgi:hypothetical protein